jgi:ubiquinone/menaquinone biosynthesis C-methylase UbiE
MSAWHDHRGKPYLLVVGAIKTEVNHPWFARMYLRMAKKREGGEEAEHRSRLLKGLSGRVIEVGAGNGLNFGHYPSSVTEVLAVEPEPILRKAAIEAASRAQVKVEAVDGIADALPAEDDSFDAAVASLVLCSVPDQASALAELSRVLRPGGELRFYEHVVSRRPWAARLERIADATFWPRVAGGCHSARDTSAAIRKAGFEIEEEERFRFSPGAPVPPLAHIIGIARGG